MPSDTSHSSHSSFRSGNTSPHSQTSTIEYGHETSETFRTKVETLCKTLWSSPNTGFKIERGSGGGYNRIIEITVNDQLGEEDTRDLILRIPRFERVELEKGITALKYIKQLSDILVPDVVVADLTPNNFLESPYTIQKRIPGVNLHSVYPSLSHRQQLSIAKQIGEIQLKLLRITSSVAGIVEQVGGEPEDPTITQAGSPETPAFGIRPFEVRSPCDDSDPASRIAQRLSTPAEGVLHFLHSRFQAWKQEALGPNPDDYFIAGYYDRLASIATEMSSLSLLDENVFSYCHMDFAPCNILVSINDSDLSIIISGVLDWDECGFAPKVYSCTPQSWLWAWVEDESEDESTAGEDPPTENARQVKEVYEEAVGKEFLEYTYGIHNRMARGLVRLALRGMHSNEELNDADVLLEDWEQNMESVSKRRQ